MKPEHLQALKNEIAGPGYAGLDDEQISEKLNAVDRQTDRESLDTGVLVGAVTKGDYDSLTPAGKDYVRLLTAVDSLPLTATVRSDLGALFPTASATRANLNGLFKRPGSRAEELGIGRVTPSDVANSKRA